MKAKATVIYVFMLLFVLNDSSAQNFKGRLAFGITATQISGDDLAGFNRAGFTFGIAAFLPVNEILATQLEMNFIQKGSREILEEGDSTFYQLRLNYIEVPILIDYQIKPKIHIQA